MPLNLNDCHIEEGDIILVASNSDNYQIRGKRFLQALGFGSYSKHGHNEVVSAFVCTGRNPHGFICNNYQHTIKLPPKKLAERLESLEISKLENILTKYKDKLTGQADKLREAIGNLDPSMRSQLGLPDNLDEITDVNKTIDFLLTNAKQDKKTLISLITLLWQATGESEILQSLNSSLLVFKIKDPEKRARFLEEYQKQMLVTQQYNQQEKQRTSTWKVFLALFQSSKQDAKDLSRGDPSDQTYCSRQVIQVLNKVDPELTGVSRHSSPKTLEAALRSGTKIRPKKQEQLPNIGEQSSASQGGVLDAENLAEDDFEALLAAATKKIPKEPEPDFKLMILPSSGTNFWKELIEVMDAEIQRIGSKKSEIDIVKARDLQKIVDKFRKRKPIGISEQVEFGLELIATALPLLQKKTGFLGSFIPSTSYSNIRAYARTQGIFDGDIREAMANLPKKQEAAQATCSYTVLNQQGLTTSATVDENVEKQIYVFCDWSFINWSGDKKEFMLEHMKGLLDRGHTLYIRKDNELVKADHEFLENAINPTDIDNFINLAPDLLPDSREQIVKAAQQYAEQGQKVEVLDYQACQDLKNDSDLATHLEQAAKLFCPGQPLYNVLTKKIEILDIEIQNTDDDSKKEMLQKLRTEYEENRKNIPLGTSFSGVDTKAARGGKLVNEVIFKPVSFMSFTPLTSYYREKVFSEVEVATEANSEFELFQFKGMDYTENLKDCVYHFIKDDLTDESISRSKKQYPEATMFKGTKTLNLNQEWQPLPSLHPGESLLKITSKQLENKKEFEIKYSEENRLYYIRLKELNELNEPLKPRKCEINFLLKMPKEYTARPELNTIMSLRNDPKHEGIHKLLMKYYQFGNDGNKLRANTEKIKNGKEYLEKAKELKIGSCRVRAIAFKKEMEEKFRDIPVLITHSKTHAFVEMQINGAWQKYCLGGYRDVPTLMDRVNEEIDKVKERFNFGSKKSPEPTSPQKSI